MIGLQCAMMASCWAFSIRRFEVLERRSRGFAIESAGWGARRAVDCVTRSEITSLPRKAASPESGGKFASAAPTEGRLVEAKRQHSANFSFGRFLFRRRSSAPRPPSRK